MSGDEHACGPVAVTYTGQAKGGKRETQERELHENIPWKYDA